MSVFMISLMKMETENSESIKVNNCKIISLLLHKYPNGGINIVLGAHGKEEHLKKCDVPIHVCVTNSSNEKERMKYLIPTLHLNFNDVDDLKFLLQLKGLVANLIFDTSTVKFWNKDVSYLLPLLQVGGYFFVQNMQGIYYLEVKINGNWVEDGKDNCIATLDKNGDFHYGVQKINVNEKIATVMCQNMMEKYSLFRYFKFKMYIGHGFAMEKKIGMYQSGKMVLVSVEKKSLIEVNKMLIRSVFLDGIPKNIFLPLHMGPDIIIDRIQKRIERGKLPENVLVDGKINYQFDCDYSEDKGKYPIKDGFMEVDSFFIITRKW